MKKNPLKLIICFYDKMHLCVCTLVNILCTVCAFVHIDSRLRLRDNFGILKRWYQQLKPTLAQLQSSQINSVPQKSILLIFNSYSNFEFYFKELLAAPLQQQPSTVPNQKASGSRIHLYQLQAAPLQPHPSTVLHQSSSEF